MTITQLWDFTDPQGSLERFLAAADSASEPERSRLLTQAARAQGLLGNFAEGHEILDAVEASELDDLETQIRVVLERGRLFRSGDEVDAAAPFFDRAAELSRSELNTPVLGGLHVDALHMQALVPQDFQQQIELNQHALEVCESSTEESALAWKPSLLNNLACAQADAGELQAAKETFEAALEASIASGVERKIEIAREMLAWIDEEIASN